MRKKVHIGEHESKLSKKANFANDSRKAQKKDTQRKNNKLENKNNKANKLSNIITKVNVTYFVLFLLDIILVVYSARQNVVNYVTVLDQDVFVSKTRYLLLGRNYINLIITVFFYLYICLMNRFFLQRKNTKNFLGCLLVGLVFLNLVLFFLFTKRVY